MAVLLPGNLALSLIPASSRLPSVPTLIAFSSLENPRRRALLTQPLAFARILEVLLGQQVTNCHIEVINAAMRGIDSHIIRRIARDCARCQPDLFLLYMGNNEAIGLHSPDPSSSRVAMPISILRGLQSLRSSRTGQLLNVAFTSLRSGSGLTSQDMAYFRANRLSADDPRRERIYSYFRANLQDLVAVARDARAKVLVSSLPVNLADFPPLGSLHRTGLPQIDLDRWDSLYSQAVAAESTGRHQDAIDVLLQAARIDDHYAELQFRLGRCFLALQRPEKAVEHFQLARDWDALQFRTDRRLNSVIRSATERAGEGVVFLEGEKAFAASPLANAAIPGARLFNDHVHFTFDGDYLLARTFLPGIITALGLQTNGAILSREECAAALGFSAWDEVNVAGAMVQMTAKPPFVGQLDHDSRQAKAEADIRQRTSQFGPAQIQQVLEFYRAAIARRPEDWQLRRNLAGFYMDLKDYAGAMRELGGVGQLLTNPLLLVEMGNACLGANRVEEARSNFQAALTVAPGFPPAREGLARIEGR